MQPTIKSPAATVARPSMRPCGSLTWLQGSIAVAGLSTKRLGTERRDRHQGRSFTSLHGYLNPLTA